MRAVTASRAQPLAMAEEVGPQASDFQGATGAHSTQWQLRRINNVPTPDI